MACFHPMHGFRSASGSWQKKPGADLPPLAIPCNRCRGCRLERSRQWAVRIMHESSMHEQNSFITLTYSDEELPKYGNLNKKHFQDFAKRVRKNLRTRTNNASDEIPNPLSKPFRYYQCGEFGDDNGRPHYHLCCFGLDFSEDRKLHKITKHGDKLYTSETLDSLWKKGHAYIGELTFESAAYVARYVMKKYDNEKAEEEYSRFDEDGKMFQLQAPYATMSLKPGIGADWLKKFHGDVYPSDEVIINAQRTRPPTYYDTQLRKTDPELLAQLKIKRLGHADLHRADQTPQRLADREYCLDQRLSIFKREI